MDLNEAICVVEAALREKYPGMTAVVPIYKHRLHFAHHLTLGPLGTAERIPLLQAPRELQELAVRSLPALRRALDAQQVLRQQRASGVEIIKELSDFLRSLKQTDFDDTTGNA